eukprot:7376964-Pyramimonas_sp.AAC.1
MILTLLPMSSGIVSIPFTMVPLFAARAHGDLRTPLARRAASRHACPYGVSVPAPIRFLTGT